MSEYFLFLAYSLLLILIIFLFKCIIVNVFSIACYSNIDVFCGRGFKLPVTVLARLRLVKIAAVLELK